MTEGVSSSVVSVYVDCLGIIRQEDPYSLLILFLLFLKWFSLLNLSTPLQNLPRRTYNVYCEDEYSRTDLDTEYQYGLTFPLILHVEPFTQALFIPSQCFVSYFN